MHVFVKHIHRDYLYQSHARSGLLIPISGHLLILFSIIQLRASIFILCNDCFMPAVLLSAYLVIKFRLISFVYLIHHLFSALIARPSLYFDDKLGRHIKSREQLVSIFSFFISGGQCNARYRDRRHALCLLEILNNRCKQHQNIPYNDAA